MGTLEAGDRLTVVGESDAVRRFGDSNDLELHAVHRRGELAQALINR